MVNASQSQHSYPSFTISEPDNTHSRRTSSALQRFAPFTIGSEDQTQVVSFRHQGLLPTEPVVNPSHVPLEHACLLYQERYTMAMLWVSNE